MSGQRSAAAKRLNDALELADYAALRAYAGPRKSVAIVGVGIAGVFLRDAADQVSADNGGTVIVSALGVRWKRDMSGAVATPAWFGLPLVSAGVDNTAKLQAVLDCLTFEFPAGFQSSCKTLYPRSHSVGKFNDAKFTLLDGQPAGTQVLVLGTAAGYKCQNSVFYGGVFDGNRANNTASTNPGTISGGDGGLHGIQVHNARGVRWYNPKTINCGTDGVIVWQKSATEPGGATEIADVHFYSLASDNNARQGVSVIACDDMHFYNAVFSNTGIGTGAKLPRAGIDIEGNTASDNVGVYFHGKTLCKGNTGRGFMAHNPGGIYNVTFDDLILEGNNVGGDGQFVVHLAAGNAANNISARRVKLSGSGAATYGVQDTSYAVAAETPLNSLTVGVLDSDVPVAFRSRAVLDVGLLVARGVTVSTDTASAMFFNCKGRVRQVEAYNTSGNQNGFSMLLSGTNRFTVDRAYTSGKRGVHVTDGAENKTVEDLVVDGAMTGSAVRLYNAKKNRIGVKVAGTLAGDRVVSLDGTSDENDIDVTWTAATGECVLVSGARNRIRIRSTRAAGDSAISLLAAAVDNLIHSSYFKGQTGAGFVTNAGTGTLVAGCFPKAINTP